MFEKRRSLGTVAAMLLLLLIAAPLRTEAAWVQNSDGTYSYYNSSGKKLTNQWIGGTYYVNLKGIRQTGWMYKGKKWYYFDSKGKLVRSKWLRSSTNRYYAGKDGVIYASGRYKIGSYYYGFNERGQMLTGIQVFKEKKYYFNKTTGRMVTKKWVKTNGDSYYFNSSGAMVTEQWVGLYYVDKSGKRLTSTWMGKKYLGSDGRAVRGLQKIDGVYYYFNTKTYEKTTSSTLTLDGITYKFDSKGKGTVIKTSKAPATKVSVESTYYSDVYVDEETLLAAIIYCEAGNQSYEGQQAVGMVIMNRVYSIGFPNTIREVVYARTQFEPARNGSLTRALKEPALVTASCKKAAKAVLKKYENYTSGKKVYLKTTKKNISFPYLFFMTKAAYTRLGLKASYLKLGDHVFFKTWK